MIKKDKFAQMQKQGGGVGSFQETLVQAATTVAAIEKQAGMTVAGTPSASNNQQQGRAVPNDGQPPAIPVPIEGQGEELARMVRLPNPQIPVREYNLVSQYCSTYANMTRQDFVELAILEKLHNDGQMPDDEFNTRRAEVRSRPSRGQRKGTKQTSK
jgi:hypothetical protein